MAQILIPEIRTLFSQKNFLDQQPYLTSILALLIQGQMYTLVLQYTLLIISKWNTLYLEIGMYIFRQWKIQHVLTVVGLNIQDQMFHES